MLRINGGARGDVRSSALWGTGNRGGESRSSALWGKGARGLVTAVVAMFILGVPLAASSSGGGSSNSASARTYIAPGLLDKANQNPGKKYRVIIQSSMGASDAENASHGLGALKRKLGLVGAVAVEIPGGRLAELEKRPGLTITPDAPVAVQAVNYSTQVWPYADKLNQLWNQSSLPT